MLGYQEQEEFSIQDKERVSNSTTASEFDRRYEKTNQISEINFEEYRVDLFEKNSNVEKDISVETNSKAVSWIITVCWNKNIEPQCLWSTLLLFYSFKAKKQIKKKQIELIMFTCLNLSLKMHATKKIELEELLQMSVRKPSLNSVIEMELTILEMVDYDLVISHNLEAITQKYFESPDKLQKIYFLSELFMLKNYTIFFEDFLIESVIDLIENKENTTEVKEKILELLKLKEARIISQKYLSKFDVEVFIHSLKM